MSTSLARDGTSVSAEDKAAWETVPAELRPVLRKYEQQRVEFVNEKAREAAQVRTQAAQDVERANAVIVQAAQWWQQTGPALQRAFANKWAQVDWKTLAEKEPAEYARLEQFPGAIEQYDLWIASHPLDAKLYHALNSRCRARASNVTRS